MSKVNSIESKNTQARQSYSNKATSNQLLPRNSYASHAKSKKELSRILKATRYSIDGFRAAYKYKMAFRQVVWLNFVLFIVKDVGSAAQFLALLLLFILWFMALSSLLF